VETRSTYQALRRPNTVSSDVSDMKWSRKA
jgi:hypothetical protein